MLIVGCVYLLKTDHDINTKGTNEMATVISKHIEENHGDYDFQMKVKVDGEDYSTDVSADQYHELEEGDKFEVKLYDGKVYANN